MLDKTVCYSLLSAPPRIGGLRGDGGELRDPEVTEHRWVTAPEPAFFDFLPADIPLIQQLQGNVTG